MTRNVIKEPTHHPAHFWLFITRLFWVASLAGTMIVLVFLMPRSPQDIYTQYQFKEALPGAPAFIDKEEFAWIVIGLDYLSMVVFLALSLFLIYRKPGDIQTVLTSALMINISGGTSITYIESRYAIANSFTWLDSLQILNNIVMYCGLTFFFYIFPDGRFFPSCIGRLVGGFLAITVTLLILPINYGDNEYYILMGSIILLALGAVANQNHRYKSYFSNTQRQQTKLVIWGFAAFPTYFILHILVIELLPTQYLSEYYFLSFPLLYIVTLLIPVTLTVSILRYRLWEIDFLIRRTLVYSLLTGLLSGIYFGGVALLQGVLTADSRLPTTVRSQPSAVVIVITTLAIAALANPLRRLLQTTIDRRFYRQKYDAEKALADFAITTRSQTDLSQISTHLTGMVNETLQPEQVSLWLRSGEISSKGIHS